MLSFFLFVVMQQTHGKWTLHLNHLVFFSAVFLEVLHLTGSYIGGIVHSLFKIRLYDGVKPLKNLVNKIIVGCFIRFYVLYVACMKMKR